MTPSPPQTTAIEYPKLVKFGGFKYKIKRTVIKYLIILVISGLIAGFTGYTVQNSFRNITGYNKVEVITEEVQEAPVEKYESDNVLLKLKNTLSTFTEELKNSDIVGKASEASVNLLTKTFQPLLDVLDKVIKFIDTAAFWVPFILVFIVIAWFTNKILSAKQYFSDDTNPHVIENITILEAKVKELVDRVNGKVV